MACLDEMSSNVSQTYIQWYMKCEWYRVIQKNVFASNLPYKINGNVIFLPCKINRNVILYLGLSVRMRFADRRDLFVIKQQIRMFELWISCLRTINKTCYTIQYTIQAKRQISTITNDGMGIFLFYSHYSQCEYSHVDKTYFPRNIRQQV